MHLPWHFFHFILLQSRLIWLGLSSERKLQIGLCAQIVKYARNRKFQLWCCLRLFFFYLSNALRLSLGHWIDLGLDFDLNLIKLTFNQLFWFKFEAGFLLVTTKLILLVTTKLIKSASVLIKIYQKKRSNLFEFNPKRS